MQQVNGVTINKLTLAKYRELKGNNQVATNESYVVTDIDEQLPIYKETLDVNNPIILRNLDTGIYKIYGYFKYYSSQSGISGVDPFAYVIVEKGTSYSYATIISTNSIEKFKITNSSYENLDDTGWIDATLTSDFIPYSNSNENKPRYRKKNGIVYIRGCVSPKAELEASATGKIIFTLPTGYRTSFGLIKVCQGSGKNVWCLAVNTNGTVTIARYGTTANAKIPTTAWLPFEISFPV